jgi:hypothetical protein
MDLNNLRMENQQGMNLIEYAQARILPERCESFQDLFIIDKKTCLPIIILFADHIQESESYFCHQKDVQKDRPLATWKNWTNNIYGIPLPR